MEENGEKSIENGKKLFQKGNPGGPGRPKGSLKEKTFLEYYNEIAEDLAKENGMDVEEVKKIIYKVGYKKAKEGNYSFYKDILDRTHGQATQRQELEIDFPYNITIIKGGGTN